MVIYISKLTVANELAFLSLLQIQEDFLTSIKAFFIRKWIVFVAKTGAMSIRHDAPTTSLNTFVIRSKNPLDILQQSLDVFVIADLLWKFIWLDVSKTVS